MVDSIQYVARLSEALSTLLVPHDLKDARTRSRSRRPEARWSSSTWTSPIREAPPCCANFNLRIEPGERVGLVGRSGSGKSTMLSLLQRFRDVGGAGADRWQGHRLADPGQLAPAISVVPQDVMLFHRSVLENIRYGKPEATDDEVYAAAEAAGCDFIAGLPEGFETIVGDRGVKLSGGQRQRLAIARAFLRDAPILLLDEATSALDSESEQAVQRALDRLMTGRTVIAVAHRLPHSGTSTGSWSCSPAGSCRMARLPCSKAAPDLIASCCAARPSTSWARGSRRRRRPDQARARQIMIWSACPITT